MCDSASSKEENKANKSNHTAANQPSTFKLPSSSSSASSSHSNIPSRRSSGDGDSDWNTASASNKSHRPPSSRPKSASSMLTTRRPSLSGAVYSSSQVGLRKYSAASHGNLCNTAFSLLPREMRSNLVPGYSLHPQNLSCDNTILSAIENSLRQQKEDLKKYFDEKFSELQKDLACMNKKVSVLQESWSRGLSPFGNSSDVILSEVSSYNRSSSSLGSESVTSRNSPKPHQSVTRMSQASVQSTSPTQVSGAIRKGCGIAVQSPLLTTISGKVRLYLYVPSYSVNFQI